MKNGQHVCLNFCHLFVLLAPLFRFSFQFHPVPGNIPRQLASNLKKTLRNDGRRTSASATQIQKTCALVCLALEDKTQLKFMSDTVKTFPVKHIVEPTPTPTNTERTDTIVNPASKIVHPGEDVHDVVYLSQRHDSTRNRYPMTICTIGTTTLCGNCLIIPLLIVSYFFYYENIATLQRNTQQESPRKNRLLRSTHHKSSR